ncbi:YisL family protein [Mesobacillus maritimus]|nr:YisL family protein [Mesobacillus maritimus]MCM3586103.1 YisL family protein [Mesobacillus maritimus]MCM3667430.1 YisL family protein [Mesobacillus maritimus]
MVHAHMTAWFLALILFFVAIGLQKSGKEKGFKVLKMVLRVFYILIIGTGLGLIFSLANISFMYIVKVLVGIWVIAMVEIILSRKTKGASTKVPWILFIIALVLVLYLGFSLPLGTYLFK